MPKFSKRKSCLEAVDILARIALTLCGHIKTANNQLTFKMSKLNLLPFSCMFFCSVCAHDVTYLAPILTSNIFNNHLFAEFARN